MNFFSNQICDEFILYYYTYFAINSLVYESLSMLLSRGSGAGWAFAHPVFREQNRKPVPTFIALK